MNVNQILEINRDLFYTALIVAMPALAISLLVGLLVSLFQTVTSLQDQTIGYVPKILLVGLVIVLTMAFSLQQAVDFTYRMYTHAAGVTR
ncbi:flagellar biosynthetic protein FliQ [Zavarzinella formosa]|uniref:flagellar biosynthetic protein FliQ n=1 Tax=Zavarzinella formosa TaxID=360055 RepID=UPI0002F506B9|nr:flagellar biosynthetic protein FliQ [Zavarzinella formosa]